MSYVYFIGTTECEQSWLKIGYTSGSVYARCATLQTGCPFPLTVVVHAFGTMADEQWLHERFADFRGYGEWFIIEGSLQGYLAALVGSASGRNPAPTLWIDALEEVRP